jgi:tetratricopeptide (TPR) repeat protein
MARPKAGREAANRTAMTVQFNSVDQALRKAKALSKKGSVGEAQAAYRWVLENFPNNKRALEGLQALGTSRAPNGSSRELTQDQAQALIALYKQGRIAEALQKAQALAVLHPDVVFLNNFLGVCNTALGRPEPAVARFQKALETEPHSADIHANLGDALAALDRPKDAIASFQRAIALNPGLTKAHNNLGGTYMKTGEVQQAAESYARATEVDPKCIDAHANLGLALVKLGRPQKGADACRRAIELDADFQLAYINLAHADDALGEPDSAITHLEKAIALKPKHSGAHSNLCEILERLNRLDDLRDAINRAAYICGTGDPRIKFRMAQLAARDKDHETARSLLEQMPETGLTPAITKGRLTLLGKTCDKIGDHAAAFTWFTRANDYVKDMPATREWDPAGYRRDIETLYDSFSGLTGKPWTDAPHDDAGSPVFMIGFPRSGTTLLDTIMRSHPDIVVLEEMKMVYQMRRLLDGLPDAERLRALDEGRIEALRQAYLDELRLHTGDTTERSVVIDKLPLNIVQAGLIKRVFPNAKFMLSLRHPCDCVLSCFMQNFTLNNPMANFLDLEDSARLYDGTMRLWRAYEAALKPDVHTIRYEVLIEDMEGVASGVLDYLGLEWHDNLKNYRETALSRGKINTPSYQQVVEPLYTRARGRWENYREQMAPVLPLLEPWAESWGYGR